MRQESRGQRDDSKVQAQPREKFESEEETFNSLQTPRLPVSESGGGFLLK